MPKKTPTGGELHSCPRTIPPPLLPHSTFGQTGILHGECYSFVATSLALHSELLKTTLYSDHLGSITFLTSTPQPHILTTKPARSYYR